MLKTAFTALNQFSTIICSSSWVLAEVNLRYLINTEIYLGSWLEIHYCRHRCMATKVVFHVSHEESNLYNRYHRGPQPPGCLEPFFPWKSCLICSCFNKSSVETLDLHMINHGSQKLVWKMLRAGMVSKCSQHILFQVILLSDEPTSWVPNKPTYSRDLLSIVQLDVIACFNVIKM